MKGAAALRARPCCESIGLLERQRTQQPDGLQRAVQRDAEIQDEGKARQARHEAHDGPDLQFVQCKVKFVFYSH